MNKRIALAFLVTMLFANVASAKGVSIDPGLWEMTATMTMSMMPQPQTTVEKECIQETELNPEDFDMDEENPCTISDVSIDGDTARWSINCPTENGMAMKGQWEFTSHGDSITGSGSMTANMAGQEMGFNMTWEGKRLGACP